MKVHGPVGLREVVAEDFFLSLLTTALEPDEILTDVVFGPWRRPWGWAFEEFGQSPTS